MSDVLLLYLFTRADAISSTFVFMAMASGLGGLLSLMFGSIDENEKLMSIGKASIAICLAATSVYLVVPDKNDIAIIVGGKYALDVGRSDTGKAVAGEVLDAIRAQLRLAAEQQSKK